MGHGFLMNFNREQTSELFLIESSGEEFNRFSRHSKGLESKPYIINFFQANKSRTIFHFKSNARDQWIDIREPILFSYYPQSTLSQSTNTR